MILSVSRRTDIPAFYSDWFFSRLKAGFVLVRNPMNPKQIIRVALTKETVECIVFWTKNPKPMLERLEELKGYDYYFQVTMTSYGKDIEPGVPSKREVLDTFIDLSKNIGKEKVIWRYDPIILTDTYDEAYHYMYFERMAKKLSGHTEKCIIGFIDWYKKTEKNMKSHSTSDPTSADKKRIAKRLYEIANEYNISLETCSESIDYSDEGIRKSKCIDDRLISRIKGIGVEISKDMNQRESCSCVKSIDIGAYDTCPHQCHYCYANSNPLLALNNHQDHIKTSPLLFGRLKGDEKITDRKIETYFNTVQLKLF